MLEETYDKFKKNILPKHKLEQPHFQEPEVEYCEPQQVLDICSYNHYSVLEKVDEGHVNITLTMTFMIQLNKNMNLNMAFMKIL